MPVVHGPDDHRVLYIGSEGYRTRHDLSEIRAMGGGVLDGLNGAITTVGMDTGFDTCVFTTPIHAQSPDAEAALRLLDAVVEVRELAVDTGPLQSFANELARHYAELADRLERTRTESANDDRMYM